MLQKAQSLINIYLLNLETGCLIASKKLLLETHHKGLRIEGILKIFLIIEQGLAKNRKRWG